MNNSIIVDITATLSGISLFERMTSAQIRRLLEDRRCVIKNYTKNQIVHIEGEPCAAAEIIIEGEIAIERISEEGSTMLITRFGSGDILGGNLVFSSDETYPMTITCRQKCMLLSLEKELLLDLMHNERLFLLNFLRIISDNTSLLSGKIRQTVNRPLRQRIFDYIEQQIDSQGSQKIRLTMTKRELAESFGVQRTSLSRELRKMKDAGLIDYDSETITLIV